MLSSDIQINTLISSPKHLVGLNPREVNKMSHKEKNYSLEDSNGNKFNIYVRQNNRLTNDFSCGLSVLDLSGVSHTLVRYNGSSHNHPNYLEKTETGYECHIHKATERYIQAGRKADGYAEQTRRYHTLKGALHCLVNDCNISGIETEADHPVLFILP